MDSVSPDRTSMDEKEFCTVQHISALDISVSEKPITEIVSAINGLDCDTSNSPADILLASDLLDIEYEVPVIRAEWKVNQSDNQITDDYFKSTTQTDYIDYDYFFQRIEDIKSSLMGVDSEINRKVCQNELIDKKIDNLKDQIISQKYNATKLAARIQENGVYLEEIDRASAYFRDEFQVFTKEKDSDIKLNQRFLKLEAKINSISNFKLANKRANTRSQHRLVLTPRSSKPSKEGT